MSFLRCEIFLAGKTASRIHNDSRGTDNVQPRTQLPHHRLSKNHTAEICGMEAFSPSPGGIGAQALGFRV